MVPSTPLLLFVCLGSIVAQAFVPANSRSNSVFLSINNNNNNNNKNRRCNGGGGTQIFLSSPIPTGDRPPPRRTLKKRKNKRRQRMDQLSNNTDNNIQHTSQQQSLSVGGGNKNDSYYYDDDDDDDDEIIEIRPVRRRDAVEAGLDYWIDETDLKRERQRRMEMKNRKPMEVGAISKEKLRNEVVAPYKQNWIGLVSVFIVILSAIGTAFPELLQIPVIPIPDL
ncbi:hypothetical protein ACHAXR_001047 [Thalassiosira sp. AJA248-18]